MKAEQDNPRSCGTRLGSYRGIKDGSYKVGVWGEQVEEWDIRLNSYRVPPGTGRIRAG